MDKYLKDGSADTESGNTPVEFSSKEKIDKKKAETYFKKVRTVKSLKSKDLSLVEINPKTASKEKRFEFFMILF